MRFHQAADAARRASATRHRRGPVLPAALGLALCLGSLVADRRLEAAEPVPRDPRAETVGGESFAGNWTGFVPGEPWQLEFQVGGQSRRLAASELVRWGAYRDRSDRGLVVLSDGSLLAAEFLSLDDRRLRVYSDVFGEVAIRLGQVRGAVLLPPLDPLQRDLLLQRVLRAERGSDRLLLDNGDVIHGALGRPRDQAAEDRGANAVTLPAEDVWIALPNRPPAPIPLPRVTALIFNPTLVDAPTPRGPTLHLGLRDGTLLHLQEVRQENGWLRLATVGGLSLEYDLATAREVTTYLRSATDQITYLSDLQPLGYKHIPFLELSWDFGGDRNVLGGRLRGGGRIWPKGLGMHSTSRLAYRWDGRPGRFEADIALDEQAGRRGSVVFRVFRLDEDGWTAAYESPVVRAGQPPRPVSVPLEGARGLALIVDFADWGDQTDYANWLGARIVHPDSSDKPQP